MDRVIFHCDLNCFYASVELLSHPELREVPVAVAGDPASRHGIILAKNEPAKQCGVKTAETIWQAKKKCPNLVLLPAHHKLYREYSNKVNAIYDEYTDLAESFGIDEKLAGRDQHPPPVRRRRQGAGERHPAAGETGAGVDPVCRRQLQQGLCQAGQRL